MTIGYYIQTLVSFSIIVALLWICLKYVKKIQIKRLSKEMAIVDRLPVSKSGAIVIAQIKKYHYVLGVTETDIKILDKLERDLSEIEETKQKTELI